MNGAVRSLLEHVRVSIEVENPHHFLNAFVQGLVIWNIDAGIIVFVAEQSAGGVDKAEPSVPAAQHFPRPPTSQRFWVRPAFFDRVMFHLLGLLRAANAEAGLADVDVALLKRAGLGAACAKGPTCTHRQAAKRFPTKKRHRAG
jgi:hypothetical protein